MLPDLVTGGLANVVRWLGEARPDGLSFALSRSLRGISGLTFRLTGKVQGHADKAAPGASEVLEPSSGEVRAAISLARTIWKKSQKNLFYL